MSQADSAPVALVVGGTHGIGLEVARAFHAAGYRLFVVGRQESRLRATLEQLGDAGRVGGMAADISAVEQTRRIVASAIDAFGQIDVVLNVAGVFFPGTIFEMNEHDYDAQFDINTKGLYFMMQSAANAMRRGGRGGAIINVSSVASQHAPASTAVYSASKAALEQLTRAVALELAPHGIRVNCIVPGNIEMPTNVLMSTEERRAAMAAATPARRNGLPCDVAELALFLASDRADFIHGTCVTVDGGLSVVA